MIGDGDADLKHSLRRERISRIRTRLAKIVAQDIDTHLLVGIIKGLCDIIEDDGK
jgi:hypothetical protein